MATEPVPTQHRDAAQAPLAPGPTVRLSRGGVVLELAPMAGGRIAQITFDKTVRGYQNGLFPFINVLNAQNALAQARITYIQAVYDAASATSTLQATVNGGAAVAAGGPSTPSSSVPATGGTSQPGNTTPPGANSSGASPAGAGTPGTTPSGTSTTGPSTTGRGTP